MITNVTHMQFAIQPDGYHFYKVPAIHNFLGALHVKSYLESISNSDIDIRFFDAILYSAYYKFARSGLWDGNIRDMHVFSVPGTIDMQIGVLWKQLDNKAMFICSPVKLPLFEKDHKINV